MPFRAYSERSRMTCSAEAYQGIVMRRPPGWAPDRSGAREDAGPASSSVVAPGVRHPLGHDRLGDVPYLLVGQPGDPVGGGQDRKSTRLNSSHEWSSYAVFCLKKKKK